MQLTQLTGAILVSTLALAANLRAQDAFEVASLKRNNSPTDSMRFPPPANGQFVVANVSLKVLISYGFNVQGSDISGDPAWVASDKYDVTAKAPSTNVSLDQYRRMVQALLTDRFKLATHQETKERNGFMLVTAKGGPKLAVADAQSCSGTCGTFFTGPSSLDARKMSMPQFANTLTMVLGSPVLDKTEIPGTFDIHLEFNPEGTNLTGRGPLPLDAAADEDRPKPSLFTALQQQAGLKLESQKVPATMLVIDHIERTPSENLRRLHINCSVQIIELKSNMQTGKAENPIIASALRARTSLGQLLRRVEDERRSLVIEKRGTPKAVLLSIHDYVRLAAPEPEVLRLIGEESKRKGTNKITSRHINQVIYAARADKSKRG